MAAVDVQAPIPAPTPSDPIVTSGATEEPSAGAGDAAAAEDGLTYATVADHSAKNDLYVVIHDKVYNASSFVDEHPGGEEVLLDVGGQDATEAFEDVGHSDEAREILEGMLIGPLKRQAGDPKPKATAPSSGATGDSSGGVAGLGVGLYLAVLAAGVGAYFGWKYVQAKEGTKST
ncbi:MAG: hypothetical protein M1825_000529 [Sarcosagium campestre]|nr:MAG: hypothetical protein M1825_000529 [Sarcosagium campestre]